MQSVGVHTATAGNPDRSVVVEADAMGLPAAVALTPAALRTGERAVAAAVLALTAQAARHAAAADRAELERRGVATDILDALGMPQHRDLPDDAPDEPVSWLCAP